MAHDNKAMFPTYPFFEKMYSAIKEANSMVDGATNPDDGFKAMMEIAYENILKEIDTEIATLATDAASYNFKINMLIGLKTSCLTYIYKMQNPLANTYEVSRKIQLLLEQQEKDKTEKLRLQQKEIEAQKKLKEIKSSIDQEKLQADIKEIKNAPDEVKFLGWLSGTRMSLNIAEFPLTKLQNFIDTLVIYNTQTDAKLPKTVHEGFSYLKNLLNIIRNNGITEENVTNFVNQAKFMFANIECYRNYILEQAQGKAKQLKQ